MECDLLSISSKHRKLNSVWRGALEGCKGAGGECQSPGIIRIWISRQFPEFPDFIREVREVRSEWSPLISLL